MPAKTSPRVKNKKLTEFFVQRSSLSALETSSADAAGAAARATAMSTTRKRPSTRASTVATGRESSQNSSRHMPAHDTSSVCSFPPGAPVQARSASTMVTRKRARSPDSNDHTTLPPSKLKHPKKPTKTPDRRKAVVFITSPSPAPKTSSAQRAKTVQVPANGLVPSPSDSSKEVVYSSQSDEAELVLPNPEPRDLGKVVKGVHMWRRKTFGSFHSTAVRECEDSVEVGPVSSSPTCGSPEGDAYSASSYFEETRRSSAASQTPVVASASLPSPPDTDKLPPLPPTPKAIDPESKTTKLIEEIKARAYAAQHLSDEERPLSLSDLEDSDDDDLIGDLPLTGGAKGKSSLSPASRTAGDIFSSPMSSAPSTLDDFATGPRVRKALGRGLPSRRPTRTSARTRKPTVSFHIPRAVAESSTAVGATRLVSASSKRKKPQAANPLHALLREKELEDKHGTSCAALRRAEEATRQGSRQALIGFDDELGTLNRLCLADEQAAWKAVQESRESSSSARPSDMEDIMVGDRESRLLGTVAGEVINKILAKDKHGKGKERARSIDRNATMGISLWMQPSDEDMEVDPIPVPPLLGHSVLTCLEDCRRQNDNSLLDMILRAGVLAAIPRDVLLSNMPQILTISIFGSSQVFDAVCIAFRDLWGLGMQMPFSAILFALVQLGADPLVLEGLGFITQRAPKNQITHETLLGSLKRLLTIMKAAAFAHAFSSDDVTSVVLSLVIMGLDPSTSNELRTQLNITMDTVCSRCATDDTLHDIHEKVLSFAKQLATINKAWLLLFFASGSGRTRCIARHLAYCFLVPAFTIQKDQAPPLEPLILLLAPEAGSCELFDVTSESTDHEELRRHVDILSVALADITLYIQEEGNPSRSASNASVLGSPNKSKKNADPPLEILRRVLEALQGRIVDTRAAHLDRSRTKAAIQRLSMRIYYDHMALLGVRSRPRVSTLKEFFSPQRR